VHAFLRVAAPRLPGEPLQSPLPPSSTHSQPFLFPFLELPLPFLSATQPHFRILIVPCRCFLIPVIGYLQASPTPIPRDKTFIALQLWFRDRGVNSSFPDPVKPIGPDVPLFVCPPFSKILFTSFVFFLYLLAPPFRVFLRVQNDFFMPPPPPPFLAFALLYVNGIDQTFCVASGIAPPHSAMVEPAEPEFRLILFFFSFACVFLFMSIFDEGNSARFRRRNR